MDGTQKFRLVQIANPCFKPELQAPAYRGGWDKK